MKTNKKIQIKNSETMVSFRCSNEFEAWLNRTSQRIKIPRSEFIRASLLNTNPQTIAFLIGKRK